MNELHGAQVPAREQAEPSLPEGEERPPAGTWAAAAVRWSLVGLMAIAAVSAWVYHAASGGVVEAGDRFRCPMHPGVVTEQKGECPICGMDLVPAPRGGAPAGGATAGGGAHGGAMHGEAMGGGAMGAVPRSGHAYTCPVHPAFVVDDARARCPECGMKVVPKSADIGPSDVAAGGGVPGLAPVDLTAERIQLSGMKTAAAAREPLSETLRTVGFVTAPDRSVVSVNVRVTGWIESLGAADLGQLVERDTVLATLYSPDAVTAQQQYLAAARWSERTSAPAAPPPTPLPYGGARDARERLVLLGFASQDVDALTASGVPTPTVNVRAPVRGYIARRAALQGLYVQPGTELFQIADLSKVWVIADVYEGELRRVRVGQRAVLELPSWPGERFEGKVTFIYPAVAAGSRTLQARVEFANPRLKLRPGMYGDVTLELGASDALVVPAEAVVDTGELQYVFVSKGNGRFEPRRVRVGGAGEGRVAVLEGLAEGERVVTTAAFLLDSESRLRAAVEGFAAPGDAAR